MVADSVQSGDTPEVLVLRETFRSILALDIENDLVRKASLGEASFESCRELFEERKAEADRTLEAMRTASATAGVSHHAKIFEATGKAHADQSKWWLIGAVASSLLTIGAALGLVLGWEVEGDVSDASVLQLVVAKGIVVAAGFLLTLNLLRMYRSHVHLSIINKHREDSLRTFRAFAEGTDDPDTKNKVLLEATHAVFAQTNTGLVDGHESVSTLEVLDGVTGLIRQRS